MTCLSLTPCKKVPQKCFNFQDGWEKSSYPGISASGETWDASCVKKGLLEKQQSVPNTYDILPLKKMFYQNFRYI